MFPGRIGALASGIKQKYADVDRSGLNKFGKPKVKRLSKRDAEIEEFKTRELRNLQEFDMWENGKDKLRFRKFPWPHWILGAAFLGSAAFILYMVAEDFWTFKKKAHEYFLLGFLLVMGLVFLYTGKIKTTIFDRQTRELIVKKRNISCHKRSYTKYKLDDISDVRAVRRGIEAGQVNNVHYAIMVEFDNRKPEPKRAIHEDTTDYESSDRELDRFHVVRPNPLKSHEDQSTALEIDQTQATEGEEIEEDKHKKHQRQKRERSCHQKLKYVFLPILELIKKRKGKKDEIKILETKDRQRVKKQLILIRRFLKMDINSEESTKVWDERGHRMRIGDEQAQKFLS